jgi:membrane-bound lytic murein transglycosylase D
MIRTLTFVMSLVLSTAGLANAATGFVSDSLLTSESQRPTELSDTAQVRVTSEDLLFSDPDLLFGRRLDSLEQTISLTYNEHVRAYIDIYLKRNEQIGRMLGLSEYYFPIFEKALKDAGLPEELKFLTVIESALNPQAVSRAGAVGPWQFMYTTAKGYGLVMDSYIDERRDPVKASYAAAHYFLDAYERIGDWLLSIAAYNCGIGAVTRAIQRSGGVADFWKVRPYLPSETRNYVPAFIATVYIMNHFQDHDIVPKPPAFSILTDVIPVDRRVSIPAIAKAAGLDLNELLILNPAYKRQVVNGTADSPKPLVIPHVGYQTFSSLYDVLNNNLPVKMPVALASQRKNHTETYHNVRSGQTLSHIAVRYGVEVQDLKVWNNLKTTVIVPGQKIRVSGPHNERSSKDRYEQLSYTVKSGDTLSGIAAKFKGATVAGIMSLNGIKGSAIVPGMKLIINSL